MAVWPTGFRSLDALTSGLRQQDSEREQIVHERQARWPPAGPPSTQDPIHVCCSLKL